jgi:hypothetical protein
LKIGVDTQFVSPWYTTSKRSAAAHSDFIDLARVI